MTGHLQNGLELAKDSTSAALMLFLNTTIETLPTSIHDVVQLGIVFYLSLKIYLEFKKYQIQSRDKDKNNNNEKI